MKNVLFGMGWGYVWCRPSLKSANKKKNNSLKRAEERGGNTTCYGVSPVVNASRPRGKNEMRNRRGKDKE